LAALGCPDVLRTRNDGYALEVDPTHCDHLQFERETAAGLDALRQRDPRRAVAMLSTALGLWRGPVFGELRLRPWAPAAAVRLAALHRRATVAWAQAQLALGEHAVVVPLLERALADDPLRESTAELLMIALYRGGRQADALAAYARL